MGMVSSKNQASSPSNSQNRESETTAAEINPKTAVRITPTVVIFFAFADIWDSRLLAGGTAPGVGERPVWAWPPI